MDNRADTQRNDKQQGPLSCDGFSTLRLKRATLRRLTRDLSMVRRLVAVDADAGDDLRRLASDARLIEAAAPSDRLRSLPACRGRSRLSIIAEELLGNGETALDEAVLMDTLRMQPLTIGELQAVPTALRVAAIEAISRVTRDVVRGAEDCARAEGWLDHPRRLPRRPSTDFIERALKRCNEEGLALPRKHLDGYLQRVGMSTERAIRLNHDARAHRLLKLDNLMRALRLMDGMEWRRCFEALCGADAELRRDPVGVYPQMDEASRDLVLDRVAELARATGLSEIAVARHAVSAARQRKGALWEVPTKLEALDGIAPEESCCWWLYDDAGRAALLKRMGKPRTRLKRRVPDPHGALCITATLALTLLFTLILCRAMPRRWMGLACLPAAWAASDAVLNRLFPLFTRPHRLLKLKLERLPDCWRTLVVTPVLLSDAEHADRACDNLEVLGCLEDDPNLAFLLLGDFPDAEHPDMPDDDAILRRARERVADMNRRAGREKYFYLHRARTFNEADKRYMGRDRKRGALMELNRLLLGGDAEFGTEGAVRDALRGQYRFVVTLDADTRMLPGTAHRLAGALAHPMNRDYAVLQPRMEVAPSAVLSRFALMFSGVGGLDTYPTAVSSLWMDLTGTGIYGGKGIYRVREFQRAVEDALPEGRVLSHDLIEGALAGSGYLGDVALYDGCPATLDGWTRRQHRWTRGDWQLLPLMLSPKLKVTPADRFRMLDNLMRSLRAPALWFILTMSTWMGRVEAVAAALPLIFQSAILDPTDRDQWTRGLIELTALPVTAFCSANAALRALWRVFVSGRRLMEWVPSADDCRGNDAAPGVHRVAALLVLPGLLVPDGAPLALALGLLFWVGADWVRGMEAEPVEDAPGLTPDQRAWLMSVARDTWRFFSESVNDDGPALPPDNVQLDPPVGAARRTSPTNIGLYLLSCIAARRLGFIESAECLSRVERTLEALDRVEKWRGHLFNWIDIDSLATLRPRYVSSVDSGNLAACALACARLIGNEALSARLRALAEGMDFAALYDDERQLFRIGVDVDANRPSESHYDLLASESRILSYTALMLGQVPLKHWARLGRRCVRVGDGAALLSWSGTMFEYLMPALLMPAPTLSLLGESSRRAVQAQMEKGIPWGVSESGYHAFDAHMNYQYRAFGLSALSMNGGESPEGGVVAPYAAALALAIQPGRACENLMRMSALHWRDEQGFYEAADAHRPGPDGRPALVKSHMAHHQGMALCAVCNALAGDYLSQGFMGDPRARALSLLLEERRACASHLKPLPRRADVRAASFVVQRTARHTLDVHLLSGKHAFALVTADGAVHYGRSGFDATRFYGDLTDRPDAANLRLMVDGKPVVPSLACRYDAGTARFEGAVGPLKLNMSVSLSPEDDTLYRSVEIKNRSPREARVALLDAVPVSLARPGDFQAHPAFQLLFVESEYLGDNGLVFRRRPRNPGEICPMLTHVAFSDGAIVRESRYDKVFDREGTVRFDFEGGVGAVINPASAIKITLRLSPGETARACFALRLSDPGDERPISVEPERAASLSRARTEAMLGFLGIAPALYHRLDRLTALLMDPRLATRAKACHAPAPSLSREALWPMGISGDRSILALRISDPTHVAAVQAVVKAQCFYRAMGLETDLALIDAGVGGYDRPVRDLLRSAVDASALRGHKGVFILSDLSDAQLEALRRASTLWLDSDRALMAQLRPLLDALKPRSEHPPLDPGKNLLGPSKRFTDSGFGGFTSDGGYEIDVRPGHPTPAPWCNILATDGMGLLLTERGGGFIWHGNSRFCRLTGYRGDPARERFPLSLRLVTANAEALALLPGPRPAMPFRVKHTPDTAEYRFSTEKLSGRVRFGVSDSAVLMEIDLRLNGLRGTVRAAVDWLMGSDRQDAALLRTWHRDGVIYASGAAAGVGCLCCDRIDAEANSALSVPVIPGENRIRLALGWSDSLKNAQTHAQAVRDGLLPDVQRERVGLSIGTPDQALNRMMNGFLPHQVRASRVCGRTGYYQPGGAYGFRDQLQDMLALIPSEPKRVRSHLLLCAGRQFASGDAMHWWHMPFLGVRTRIQDDRLFLPWVTAEYVTQTGDTTVLGEIVPYLEDVPVPDDRDDVYRAMTPGPERGTLHDHCMRAFRASDTQGSHGLALMGAGDWNDGMNRVGNRGKGESVWLSEFIAACADHYAEICPVESDADWLRALARRHRGAVELYGWDGRWYLRAYTDEGEPLGSAGSAACQIDLISQAWAVLAGLSPDRCKSAMDAAWSMLVDEKNSLIRLLTPPFTGDMPDPGYIRGYPAGVRENGAQYTHAACWLLLALARQGDATRAHRVLQMLLPPNHADTPEKALRYRVEPYVMAADVYDLPGEAGRGGWTWYTGSAAWLYVGVLALLGYERQGERVRLNALLGDWPEVSLSLKHGKSRYRLVCSEEIQRVTLDGTPVGDEFITLIDDGRDHEAQFPARK